MTSHGLRVLNSGHREIRRLKRCYAPSVHGGRVWPATWFLLEYLAHRGLPEKSRVADIGCGWGIAGLYAAKHHRSEVTGVDIDWDVYPYLRLHARINDLRADFWPSSFCELTVGDLTAFDVLIGADVCFWEHHVPVLRRLMCRAVDAGVKLIVLADPGRPAFNDLGDFCENRLGGEQFYRRGRRPYPTQGQILEIQN
jgi:2-polyprenyl-3-methyl-5-hydroxy-6-metoxy-1,4-benzoquinol methylase